MALVLSYISHDGSGNIWNKPITVTFEDTELGKAQTKYNSIKKFYGEDLYSIKLEQVTTTPISSEYGEYYNVVNRNKTIGKSIFPN